MQFSTVFHVSINITFSSLSS